MVTEGTKKTLRIGLRVALLLLIAGALWYAFDRIDWTALWRAILSANVWWVLAGVAATLLAHLVRAQRWRLLITDGTAIPLSRAFSATIIGYMCNNIVPRSGELVRPWVLARNQGRPLSGMIASIVVERIIDGLSLAAIVIALAIAAGELLQRLLPQYTAFELVLAVTLPILGLIVLAWLFLRTSLGDWMLRRFEPRLPASASERVRTVLTGFRSGVGLSGPLAGLRIAIQSVVIWAGYAAGMWTGFLAFGFDDAYGLGLRATIITLAITAIAITIAPTPGGFVVFHTFCIAVLNGVFGVDASEAAAFAVVSHGAPYIVVTALGAGFALVEDLSIVSLFRRRAGGESGEERGEKNE